MKTLARSCAVFGFIGLAACVSEALGQALPPVAANPAVDPRKEDTIVLSPFEVTASSDEGYAARETLAGTRFKSELKDVPSQVSVMTKEFLDDIASVTLEDAYRYSINVENTTEYTSPTDGGGDFNTGVLNTRSANRIRGLSNPGLTHDFFQSNVMQDTYNVERVSFSSGPNAILFGNGNPGGIVDSSYLRANLQRSRTQVSFRTDNYGSVRGSVDVNQPFFKEVFGLRFSAVKSRQKSWRKPGGADDDRYYGTFTVKPLRTTTIRAYYEDAMLDRTTPRNMRFGDQVTPWIKAGRPAFNNGLVNPTPLNAANAGIFARDTSTRGVLPLGAAAQGTPYTIWGSAASVNIALPATRYSAVTIGPGSQPNQTGVDSYIYSLPNDETISPFDVSVNGNGTRNLMYGKIWGASLEQRLPGDVFLSLDYNRERIRNPICDFLRGISSALKADANQFLPDRVTPNPNFGRYYVEGDPRVFGFRGDSEEMRGMVSYELDLTRRPNWTRWLGRHRTAAMYQRSESMQQQQESVQRVIPPDVSYDTVLNAWGGPTYNTFTFRTYLSDPTNGSTGGKYFVELPFDPLRTTTYTLPDGSTYVAGYKNPYGGTGSANLVNNLAEGRVLALQSFWLKNRLVTSFGWRADRIRQATYVTQRKTAVANSAFESMWNLEAPTNWSTYTNGHTNTQGAVVHVFSWLSVFYNQSSTWNPPTGLINPDDGAQVPGATGKGKDYGIMLRLFRDRVSLRLNKYYLRPLEQHGVPQRDYSGRAEYRGDDSRSNQRRHHSERAAAEILRCGAGDVHAERTAQRFGVEGLRGGNRRQPDAQPAGFAVGRGGESDGVEHWPAVGEFHHRAFAGLGGQLDAHRPEQHEHDDRVALPRDHPDAEPDETGRRPEGGERSRLARESGRPIHLQRGRAPGQLRGPGLSFPLAAKPRIPGEDGEERISAARRPRRGAGTGARLPDRGRHDFRDRVVPRVFASARPARHVAGPAQHPECFR